MCEVVLLELKLMRDKEEVSVPQGSRSKGVVLWTTSTLRRANILSFTIRLLPTLQVQTNQTWPTTLAMLKML